MRYGGRAAMPRKTLTPEEASAMSLARKTFAGGRRMVPTRCKCGAVCPSKRAAVAHCDGKR
jgi:hypothetical protein